MIESTINRNRLPAVQPTQCAIARFPVSRHVTASNRSRCHTGRREHIECCREAGMEGYVAKPYTEATLIAEIERVITGV